MKTEIIDRLKNIEKMLRMLLAQTSPLPPPTPPRWKNNEYMKPDDVATEIGVDVSTVRRWLREGRIPHSRFGKAVRIKTKDFEKFLKDNDVRP